MTSNKVLVFVALIAPMASVSWGTPPRKGVVSGVVCEWGTESSTERKGVSGADVQLRLQGGEMSERVITGAGGKYRIPQVPTGAHVLVVTKTGYVPHPHDQTTIKVDGDTTAADVVLFPNLNLQQWSSLAPSSRGQFVEDFTATVFPDIRVVEIYPEAKIYLGADADHIMEAESRIELVWTTNAPFPSKDSLNDLSISYEILADVALYQVRSATPQDEAKTRIFIRSFEAEWGDTPAVERFHAIQNGFSQTQKGPPPR